jgi:hypothetical protein
MVEIKWQGHTIDQRLAAARKRTAFPKLVLPHQSNVERSSPTSVVGEQGRRRRHNQDQLNTAEGTIYHILQFTM